MTEYGNHGFIECDTMEEIAVGKIVEAIEGKPSFSIDPNQTALPPSLLESIARFGLLHPPVAREIPGESNLQLVAGFKRLRVARELHMERMPVHVLQGKQASDAHSLRLAIEDNRTVRILTPMEISRLLHLHRRIAGTESIEETTEIPRLLGIPPRESTIRDYLDLKTLGIDFQEKIHRGLVDFEQAQVILQAEKEIADMLVEILLSGIRLNRNRLKIVAACLREIASRENIAPEQILRDDAARNIIAGGTGDGIPRGIRLQAVLHARRYPILTGLAERFREASKKITAGGLPVAIDYPTNFEGDRVKVTLNVRDEEELKSTLSKLLEVDSMDSFNDLFSLLQDYVLQDDEA